MRKETITYKTVDGVPIEADLFRPRDRREPCPVLLWIHGGALVMGHRNGLQPWQRDRYLEAGYAVVAIDYRLAPETKLPAILDDLRDAHRWIREAAAGRFALDPDRLAVIGHSGGGYLTLLAGYHLEPRPRGLVVFYGYGNILGDWRRLPDTGYLPEEPVSRETAEAVVGPGIAVHATGERDRSLFYRYCRQQGCWNQEVVGLDPAEEPEAFLPYLPVRNVTPDYPPTLLLHGDRDTDVPYAQSVEMAEALRRAGVPHRLVTVKGGVHGFGADPNDPETAHAFDAVLEFLAERLGAPPK